MPEESRGDTFFLGYINVRHASIQRHCKSQRPKESKPDAKKQRKDREKEEVAQLRDLESQGGLTGHSAFPVEERLLRHVYRRFRGILGLGMCTASFVEEFQHLQQFEW